MPTDSSFGGAFFVRIESQDFPFYSELCMQCKTSRASILYRANFLWKGYVCHEKVVISYQPYKRREDLSLVYTSALNQLYTSAITSDAYFCVALQYSATTQDHTVVSVLVIYSASDPVIPFAYFCMGKHGS